MTQCRGEAQIDRVLSPKIGSSGASGLQNQPKITTSPILNGYQLVADVGGTNTRFGLGLNDELLVATCKSFKNADFASFEAVLSVYLSGAGTPSCDSCCIAVAATIIGDTAQLTNLEWKIEISNIRNRFDIENVCLINDLEALGYALDGSAETSLAPIFTMSENNDTDQPKLVIGIGTGFNATTVRQNQQGGTMVYPSESGHMAFPLGNGFDAGICKLTNSSHGFCSIEDILSGRGLEGLFRWYSSGQSKGAAEICASLNDGSDAIAKKAARLFVTALGGVIGDLALSHLPYGGIYLAGSVARSLAPYFEQYGFLEAFENKGRKSEVMKEFNLFLLLDDFAALNGCLTYLAVKDQR